MTEHDGLPAKVRAFTRFYTQRAGVLEEHLLDSEHTLTEARIIFEIASRPETTATELRETLALDAGYLSRVLSRLTRQRLLTRQRDRSDARVTRLRLSSAGEALFAELDARSEARAADWISRLSASDRLRLADTLDVARELLSDLQEPPPVTLREPRAGDLGHIVARQGALYFHEYGFDVRYEALVAQIVAEFVQQFDAKRERCWIAERNGVVVGSVFCVAHPTRPRVARLRLLYVEPHTRGTGVGTALVRECLAFARTAGYTHMTLWTNSVLDAARRIYEREGFTLVREEPHDGWGKPLVAQTWERALT